MERVNKVIEYRRADWLDPSETTLEDYVREAWNALADPAGRTVTRRDGSEMRGIRSCDFDDGGFAIHAVKYFDGQSVGVVPMAAKADTPLEELEPEENQNFLNSDLFAFFFGNNVITMNANRNAGTLLAYLFGIFERARLPDESRQLLLSRVSDLNKVARIEEIGVKSIDLHTTISAASAIGIRDLRANASWWERTKWSMFQPVRAVFASDNSVSAIRRAEKGKMKLEITMPNGELEAVKEGMDDFAKSVVEDEESEFLIKLRNGEDLRPEEISIRETITIKRQANSVDPVEVWDEMQRYMLELNKNRRTEA